MATSRVLLLAALPVLVLGCAHRAADSAPAPVVDTATLTLVAPDGSRTTLDALTRDRDATVLVFWSGGCPCVRRYQERVDALLDRYPAERVRVLAVASNAGETHAEVLAAARERGMRVPVYRDEDGTVAAAFGARTTPTTVVLDGRGQLRYFGWIDNERLPGDRGREPWLDDALSALLAGRSDYRARRPTFGCVITRPLFGTPRPSADAPCDCSVSPPAEATP